MEKQMWDKKPYHSLDYYFKEVYGQKIYKIAIDGGMSCPNRDGVIDDRGCLFCSQGGSGEFSAPMDRAHPDIRSQIEKGKLLLSRKYSGCRYVVYFQPYTNTYAPVDYLRNIYRQALEDEETVGISIATRPDCLPMDVIDLLSELNHAYPEKFIWVELGLQTIHRKTAQMIRRGYEISVFEEAVRKLSQIQIPVIVHVILGLPEESREQMISTVEYLNTFPIFGIKLQLLHVLAQTDLADLYKKRRFEVLTLGEYTDIVIECLERLTPEMVIHRITGDGPRRLLIAPEWSLDKKQVLNTLLNKMKVKNSWQGKQYEYTGTFHII